MHCSPLLVILYKDTVIYIIYPSLDNNACTVLLVLIGGTDFIHVSLSAGWLVGWVLA